MKLVFRRKAVSVPILTVGAAVALALGAPSAGASGGAPEQAATVPGVPRFLNYVSPTGTGDDAGEPTFGVNETTEQVFSNSLGPIPNGGTVNYFGGFLPYMLKVTFNDCQSPALVTWDQKTLLTANSPRVYGDPILYTDRVTGRTFVSQLEGLTPAGSTTDITDDDGDNFMPSEGSGLPSCIDHQTFGGGPFHAPLIGVIYPNAVYYASQCVAHATCSLSLDGGVTFGQGIPMFTLADCVGLHGHIKVGPDGTAYVPNKGCGGSLPLHGNGKQAVIVSEDNGLTWDVRPVTTSSSGGLNQSWDPSVAIASDGTVYFGYNDINGRARVAVSHDKGLTWVNDRDVGASLGIKKSAFPAIAAGDPDRAAFAFYGTTTDGGVNADTQPAFPGIWYLYVATTFDGGATWITTNVTPNDPIQRGGICKGGDCRNMLDFFDCTIDKEGRVLVAWDDGCVGGCVSGPPNSFTAKATITRQSGGQRMLAVYDPVEPRIPEAPGLSGNLVNGTVSLAWKAPDNGGADITDYNVYRRVGDAGPFTLLATVTGNTYTDIVDPEVNNYYRVTALNSEGEGPYCGDFLPEGGPGPTPCLVPGLISVNDVNTDGTDNDSGQNVPPDPSVNVRDLSVSEPYAGAGVNQLTFTLRVAPSTGVIPPESQWYIIWARQSGVAPDGSDRRFVAMKTDPMGALSFVYGDFGPPIPLDGSIPPPNANTPTPLGSADFGSYDLASGVITIKLAASKLDGTPLVAGNSLAALNVRTYLARPDGGQRSQNNANDITGDGGYTLVGNASCFCFVDQPPVARLVATPSSGISPLTVDFDASTSSDPDAADGDAVATYNFEFGDGSPPVSQSSPTISHTYTVPPGMMSSFFFAKLTVNDLKCGLQSLNVASQTIEVEQGPTPVEVSLVSAEALPEKVTLTWYASDVRPVSAVVYRRTGDTEWRVLGEVAPDGAGMIVFEDPTVSPGTRYGYRLGILEIDRELHAGETWVDVPRARFQLAPLTNPSHGQMSLTLSMDRDENVKVGVFDISGRLVSALVDELMPAGAHSLHWDGRDGSGSPVPSGMYVVQARAGTRAVAARVMLLP